MTSRRGDDSRQLGLLEPTAPDEPTPGSFDIARQLRGWLSQALKESLLDRERVAFEMNRLLGHDDVDRITKAQLDAWTAPSKEGWRFPVEYLPAFVAVTRAHWLLGRVIGPCGCRVVAREDELVATVEAIERQQEELAALKDRVLRGVRPSTAARYRRSRP